MSFLMPKVSIPQPATPAQQPVAAANPGAKSGTAPSFLGTSAVPDSTAPTTPQKKLLGQ